MTLDPKALEAENDALLPCPFCGEAELIEFGGNCVSCKRCRASAYVEEFEGDEAVEVVRRWNRRAADLVPRSGFDAANRIAQKDRDAAVLARTERDEAHRDAKSLTDSIHRCWGKEAKLKALTETQGRQLAALREALAELLAEILEALYPFARIGNPPLDKEPAIIKARAALTDTAEAAAQWVPVELQAALQAQHDWHLGQTDEDQWGIIPADVYAESALCDCTISALQKTKYAAPNLSSVALAEGEASEKEGK